MSVRFDVRRFPYAIFAIALWSLASRCGTEISSLSTPVGSRAMEWTRELVAIGPRPSGSAGIEKARSWITRRAKELGFDLQVDRFNAETPIGSIAMQNLSYVIPGKSSSQKVLLLAHYDSKRFAGFDFVGANDAASSVALLLALTPEIQGKKYPFDTEIVFLDGEEALVSWSPTDSLYGSRHLSGTVGSGRPVRAAVVVDMIGDKELRLVRDENVDPKLFKILEEVLKVRGWGSLLDSTPQWIDDDHVPLLQARIPTFHLMDFTYGGKTSPGPYWHTADDTIDKISEGSLSLVGEIILDLLTRLSGS